MASDHTPAEHPLANTIYREEKRYLICTWASQLVELIEKGELLNERSIQSLRIARSYADDTLGTRIDQLLQDADGEEAPRGTESTSDRTALLPNDDLFGDEDEDLEYEDDEIFDDASAPDSTLFGHEGDVDEGHVPEGNLPAQSGSLQSTLTADLPTTGAVVATGQAAEETTGFEPKKGERKQSKVGKKQKGEELFTEEEEGDVTALQEDPFGEDDWDTGDPIERIAEGEDEEGVASPADKPLGEGESKKAADADGDEKATIVPTKGVRKESKVGEQPGDDTAELFDAEDGAEADQAEGKYAHPTSELTDDSESQSPDEETDEHSIAKRKAQLKKQVKQSSKNSTQRALERKKRAKKRFEQRKKQREESEVEGEEQDGEEQFFSLEDQLTKLTHIITVDRLEKMLGVQVIPEDRQWLERQFTKKLHEAPIRSLLDRAEEQNLSLVMIPRVNRLIRDGQLLKITGANMLRTNPQFFENVQQVALSLRAEPHFLQESPKIAWAITTTEVLPSSRNTSYIQQKQSLKQHAQSHQTNEARVRRRTLIEALYDLIVTKVVTGTELLSATADLTESSMGRQNMVFINFGENGIRISDIGRQQTHSQLGVCPNW